MFIEMGLSHFMASMDSGLLSLFYLENLEHLETSGSEPNGKPRQL